MGELSEFFKTFPWCQGAYAEGVEGHPDRGDEDAKACCIMGATFYLGWDYQRRWEFKDAFRNKVDARGPIHWNDTVGRTKEEVIAKLQELGY